MWWKTHKKTVLAATLVVVILAAAFWFGGSAPGSQGWTMDNAQAAQEEREQENASPAEETSASEDETAQAQQASAEEVSDNQQDQPTSSAAPAEKPTMEIDPATGKDQYQTDPVPEGKPLPVEPEDTEVTATTHTCTLSISCEKILENMDMCNPEKVELVPEDGWLLEPTTVTFYEGESVFNVLQRTCKQQGIHMEFEDTPMYHSAYIEGIGNLYEFDVGELSGWMYSVNGWFPNYGCSRYQLQNGDVICWVYTCDLGKDVGRETA